MKLLILLFQLFRAKMVIDFETNVRTLNDLVYVDVISDKSTKAQSCESQLLQI